MPEHKSSSPTLAPQSSQHPLKISPSPSLGGALDATPPSDGGSPLQQAANASPRMQQLQALQRSVNRGAIQRKPLFKHDEADYETSDGVKDVPFLSSSTTKMAYSKDGNLPTPNKVITDLLDDHSKNGAGNVEPGMFTSKAEAYERPHSVQAELSGMKFDDRDDPITTDIGRVGNDERYVREGGNISTYDGGHLMGAMILGKEAQFAYNIAPQESDSNRNSYNNTIEQAVRGLPGGSKVNYKVDLQYDRNNYKVDQQTLLDRGIIKALDPDKPWHIHIPSRVPKYWSAEAEITSGGKFDPLKNETFKRSEKTDEEVKEAVPNPGLKHKGGAFNLAGNGTKKLKFFLQQYVPSDTVAKAKPSKEYTDDSLLNANQYEKAPPTAKSIKAQMPGIGQQLAKDSFAYKQEMMKHGGHKFLCAYPLPPQKFPVDDATDQQCVKDAVKKVNTIAGQIPSNRDEKEALKYIDLEGLFNTAYGERKSSWDKTYRTVLERIQPMHTSLTHLKTEIDSMIDFGTKNDQLGKIDKLGESALQDRFQKAQDMKKRMAVIKATTVEDRMNYFKISVEQLEELCSDTDFYTKLFIDAFKAKVDNQILFHVASLPRYILRRLSLPDRELPNAKKSKIDYSGMC